MCKDAHPVLFYYPPAHFFSSFNPQGNFSGLETIFSMQCCSVRAAVAAEVSVWL